MVMLLPEIDQVKGVEGLSQLLSSLYNALSNTFMAFLIHTSKNLNILTIWWL